MSLPSLFCNHKREVSFCCLQIVPASLEVDNLTAEDLEITFTPRLRCCQSTEEVSCFQTAEIELSVIKLVGCIDYAISTIEGGILGDFGSETVDLCCSSTVCVNNIICVADDEFSCPDNLTEELEINPITVELDGVTVEDCPASNQSDKQIIKFRGQFTLPDICKPEPPVVCPKVANLVVDNNQFMIEITQFNGTWCYDVTVKPGSQDLSFWILELCSDIAAEDITNVTRNGDPFNNFEIVDDPITGLRGIKFEGGQTSTENTVRYCFDLNGDEDFGITTVNTGVKTGGGDQAFDIEPICGPECP
ncbi:MAG: hypothetical protein ACQEQI_08180 [Bacillota bacterium]